MSLSVGKLTVTTQLATHCAPAANDNAMARIRFGNISPSSTQTTGPHDIPKATTNRVAATRATSADAEPRMAVLRSGVLSAMFVASQLAVTAVQADAVPKMTAMVAKVIVIPAEPMISSGFRPIRSMVAIAINVVRILIVAEITVMTND